MLASWQNREPIKVIGLDCDDIYALDKLLRRQPELLRQADMICGAHAVLEKLKHDPELSGKLLPLAPPLEPLYDSIFSLCEQGLKVVVLADGDPLFFGIGASLSRRLSQGALEVKPAVSCLQAACARLNLPWDNVYCLSLHGRSDIVPLYDAIASGRPICILTGGRATPDGLARLLLDRGVDWFETHIFERMGCKDETVYKLSMKECARAFFGEASTMLLLPVKKPRAPRPGLDAERFLGSCPIPKAARGAVLELLNVEPGSNVWEIGAGSGILALEACALAHEGHVIAIEKDMERCLDIQENRRLLGAVNLDICRGAAPECLEHLPKPQRIFMGAGFSSSNASQILESCAAVLPRAGRLVVGCILSEHYDLCRNFLERLGWPLEITQLQTNGLSQFHTIACSGQSNTIFLLATQKP